MGIYIILSSLNGSKKLHIKYTEEIIE